MKKDTVQYLVLKKIIYGALTALCILFSSCSGRDAVSAMVSGDNSKVGHMVPFVIFGIIGLICYQGFQRYAKRVDAIFDPPKEPEKPKEDC